MSFFNAASVPIDRPKGHAGRLPLMAFVADATSETVLRSCLEDMGLHSAVVVRGGIAKAVQHLSSERSPGILIVDISDAVLAVSEINNLAEACEPGVTVIAIGARNDVGLYRDLLQAGVADYIVKPLTPQLLAKSLKAATSSAEATPISQKLGKLVALTGARGGVGTSTLAVNLAWHLANRQGRRVALVDLDLQNGDCSLMLNVQPTSGLREALENPLRVDSTLLERAMIMHGERLFVLGSQEPLEEQLRITADATEGLLTLLRSQFHYVIADVPRIPALAYRRTLEIADLRVIVADQTLRSTRDTVRLRPMLGSDSARHRNLLVVNRAGEGGKREVTLKEIEETVELRPRCVIPFQPKLFAAAATQGTVAATRGGRFAEAMNGLALELSGRTPKRRRWWRLFR
jgi:pilus assembly protein CpaE